VRFRCTIHGMKAIAYTQMIGGEKRLSTFTDFLRKARDAKVMN